MRRFFNTTMSSELKDFVRKVITIKGGVAEPGREDLTGEEKENLVSKIRATDQEFQRKVNDVKDKIL